MKAQIIPQKYPYNRLRCFQTFASGPPTLKKIKTHKKFARKNVTLSKYI